MINKITKRDIDNFSSPPLETRGLIYVRMIAQARNRTQEQHSCRYFPGFYDGLSANNIISPTNDFSVIEIKLVV